MQMESTQGTAAGFKFAKPACGWTRLCLVAEPPIGQVAEPPMAALTWLRARVAEEPGLALLLLRDAAGLGSDWAAGAARCLAGAARPLPGLEAALARLPAGAPLLLLGAAAGSALWLGGVRGHRVLPLPAVAPAAIEQAIAATLRESLCRDPGFA